MFERTFQLKKIISKSELSIFAPQLRDENLSHYKKYFHGAEIVTSFRKTEIMLSHCVTQATEVSWSLSSSYYSLYFHHDLWRRLENRKEEDEGVVRTQRR